jgi:formiminotetrahydrofolate cyclodeaminase
LKQAALVPLEVAEDAFRILTFARTVVAKGNKNAVTDGAVAAIMARTAVLSALYNVKINLDSIEDEGFGKEMKERVKRLEEESFKEEQEILSRVEV